MSEYSTKVRRTADKLVVESGGTLEVEAGATFTVGGTEVVVGATGLTADEVDYVVGVTPGTAAASKSLILDANKDAAGVRNFGAVQVTVGVNGASGAAGVLVVCDGANPGASISLNYADLIKIDGITAGAAAASKALVLDANKDASGVRNLGAVQVTAGVNGEGGTAGAFVIADGANPGASASLAYADLVQIDGITAGTAAASKALVLDANKDAAGVRNFGAVQVTVGVNGVGGAAGVLVVCDGANPGVSISLNYADLLKIDGITAGAAAAGKALVADDNLDISGIRNAKVAGLDFECGATDITFRVVDGKLIVSNLPTEDPGVAGALWVSSNALKISAGT